MIAEQLADTILTPYAGDDVHAQQSLALAELIAVLLHFRRLQR